MKILIIREGGVGDLIVTFPFIKKIRQLYPLAEIDYATNKGLTRNILLLNSVVSNIVLINQVITEQYDIIYDLETVIRSSFAAREGTKHQLDIICDFYDLSLTKEEKEPVLELTESLIAWGRRYLRYSINKTNFSLVNKQILGIVLQSGVVQKSWISSYMVELINRLRKREDILILLFGNSSVSFNSTFPVISLNNKTTLFQLCVLINQCSLIISSDTGPLHLAGALKISIIGLFGPNPGYLITKYYSSVYKILQKSLPCVPCWQRKTSYCNYNCMKLLSVDEVENVILEFLKITRLTPG